MKNPVLILCDQMIEDSEKRCSWIFEAAEQIRAMRSDDRRSAALRVEPVALSQAKPAAAIARRSKMKLPLYAMHKNADGVIVQTGTFDYHYKLSDWLKSLDLRAGDKIEIGEPLVRESIEEAPKVELAA